MGELISSHTIHNTCITLDWGYSICDGLFFVPLPINMLEGGVFLQKNCKVQKNLKMHLVCDGNFAFKVQYSFYYLHFSI